MNIDSEIRKGAEVLIKQKYICLITTEMTNYHVAKNLILRYLATRLPLLYVTMNQGCPSLFKVLKNGGIDVSRMGFIDGMSKGSGQIVDNCTYLTNPGSLVELSLSITDKANEGKYELLLLDSINTLLLYNDPKSVKKFLYYLINKLREKEIAGIMIALEGEHMEEVVSFVAQICDKYTKL